MAGKYIDFDAALAEAAERPVVVRYLGRDWELFTAMPARPVLELLRLEAEGPGEEQLGRGETLRFMSQMVPAKVLDAWLDGGLSLDQLAELMKAVIAAYNGAGDEAGEGEARGPAPGPTPSSNAGPR